MNDGLWGAFIGGGVTCVVAYFTLHREERIARERLLQARFTPAYLTLQLYISSWADHAQWNLDTVKIRDEPNFPEVSNRENAEVSLFTSDGTVAKVEEFQSAVRSYSSAVRRLNEIRKTPFTPGVPNPLLGPAVDQRNSSARDVIALAEAVHQRLRRELRGPMPWRTVRWLWSVLKRMTRTSWRLSKGAGRAFASLYRKFIRKLRFDDHQ